MAITQSDYLQIHKGGSSFLLLRSSTHFHLIRIGADLSEAKMERLLRLYPCDSDQLHKLGLHFSAFKATSLRGIVITGYQTGDTLELWLSGDVRKYQLGADYSDEILGRFFSGCLITRRLPHEGGRLGPNLIPKITWSLNAVSISCAIAFYFISIPYKLWGIFCISCQLSAFLLTLKFPSSFTLADDSKKQKLYRNKGKGHLLPACAAPGFALCLRTFVDFTFDNGALGVLFLVSLIASFILFAMYVRITHGARDGLIHAIVAVCATVFLGLGTVGQLNYILDFSHADSEVAEVADKYVTKHSKSTSYDCKVVLPGGECMELSLSARAYRKIDIGDNVIVTHHDGALRIPFFTVDVLPNANEME